MSSPVPDALVASFASVINVAGVGARLAGGPAVVLERIARGGGATRWFWLGSSDDLGRLSRRLSAGCVVSFYFDRCIQQATLDDGVQGQILDLAVHHGDAVVKSVLA